MVLEGHLEASERCGLALGDNALEPQKCEDFPGGHGGYWLPQTLAPEPRCLDLSCWEHRLRGARRHASMEMVSPGFNPDPILLFNGFTELEVFCPKKEVGKDSSQHKKFLTFLGSGLHNAFYHLHILHIVSKFRCLTKIIF